MGSLGCRPGLQSPPFQAGPPQLGFPRGLGLDFTIWDSLGILKFHGLGVLGIRALGSSRGYRT